MAFEAALKRAGITGFRFHDLRHTAASHLVMRGASLKDVQEVLGHTTLAMTTRYAAPEPGASAGAVERLEGLTLDGERAASAHDSAQSAPHGAASARSASLVPERWPSG